ncbi:MAG TPA: hypothetical protein VJA21_29370 [Verrucomicrobiae bacterium]
MERSAIKARVLGGLALLVALGVVLRLEARGEVASNAVPITPTVPKLPVVERPPAAQPPIGLPGDAHLDKTPPRRTVGLDLVRNGWTYNCMECHKLLTARWHYDRPLNEHKDIRLEHGNNRFCLNCHHPTNRNAFVDYDGSEIAQAGVVQLCAKCHGTIYRDWQAGAHGRPNGFWKTGAGEKTKLRCIQCHDPHNPKFEAMQPLAPLRYPPRGAHPPGTTEPATAGHR